jgi:hypothetical protein
VLVQRYREAHGLVDDRVFEPRVIARRVNVITLLTAAAAVLSAYGALR